MFIFFDHSILLPFSKVDEPEKPYRERSDGPFQFHTDLGIAPFDKSLRAKVVELIWAQSVAVHQFLK